MARCKSCGKPIDWIATPAGQRMPVEERPWYVIRPGETAGPRMTVVTDDGRVMTGTVVAECATALRASMAIQGNPGSVAGRVSHFAKCPEAAKWRGKGRSA